MKQRNLMFTIVIAVCIAAVGIGLAIAASFGILNVASAPAAIAPTAVPTIATPTTSAPATAVPTTTVPAITVPATTVPTTAAPATAVPTITVPATAIRATAVPTTSAPATAIPTIAIPATAIPATSAPATAIPAISAPATAVPATAIPTTSAPESQGQYIEYTVQRGDTLFAIARLYNVTAEDILAVNTIANPASLTIGQVLRIPTGTATTQIVEYTVQPGDILVVIARRFDVTVEEILAINTIRDPSNLTVGQVLRIPRRTP